jgi:glutathione S-transferase
LALIAARMNVQVREVNLSNKPSELLEASPKGTVPVLILANDTVIDESMDIISWAH